MHPNLHTDIDGAIVLHPLLNPRYEAGELTKVFPATWSAAEEMLAKLPIADRSTNVGKHAAGPAYSQLFDEDGQCR